ncbi:MAG: ABC transporter permease [Egibacteraceae bacterium]
MRLAFQHTRYGLIELSRFPQFWVPTLASPVIFFVLFGMGAARDMVPRLSPGLGSEVVLASFLCFGVLGLVFFQFGVGISEERHLPWETTMRALPVGGAVRFAGRVLVALVVALVSIVIVVAVAAITTELRLGPLEWVVYLAAVLLGSVPFGLMGTTLGYAASPKAALPIANIGFLLLSFLGGLFIPLEGLPSFVQGLAPFLPTRHYLDLVLGVIGGRQDGGGWTTPALLLLGWSALFLAAAAAVYRRDDGLRYR